MWRFACARARIVRKTSTADVGYGVRLFRVDNPHTKPLPFWEWLIAEVRSRFPDAIFLGEAFTRPKAMYRLAKLGFSQSYTYLPGAIPRRR
jgi:glycosidase